MSVVIIGGNECMERQYQQICKKHGCKAKVFVKEKSGFSKQIGTPDLMPFGIGRLAVELGVH